MGIVFGELLFSKVIYEKYRIKLKYPVLKYPSTPKK